MKPHPVDTGLLLQTPQPVSEPWQSRGANYCGTHQPSAAAHTPACCPSSDTLDGLSWGHQGSPEGTPSRVKSAQAARAELPLSASTTLPGGRVLGNCWHGAGLATTAPVTFGSG